MIVALNQTMVHILVYFTPAKVCTHRLLIFWFPTQNHSNLRLIFCDYSQSLQHCEHIVCSLPW